MVFNLRLIAPRDSCRLPSLNRVEVAAAAPTETGSPRMLLGSCNGQDVFTRWISLSNGWTAYAGWCVLCVRSAFIAIFHRDMRAPDPPILEQFSPAGMLTSDVCARSIPLHHEKHASDDHRTQPYHTVPRSAGRRMCCGVQTYALIGQRVQLCDEKTF